MESISASTSAGAHSPSSVYTQCSTVYRCALAQLGFLIRQMHALLGFLIRQVHAQLGFARFSLSYPYFITETKIRVLKRKPERYSAARQVSPEDDIGFS